MHLSDDATMAIVLSLTQRKKYILQQLASVDKMDSESAKRTLKENCQRELEGIAKAKEELAIMFAPTIEGDNQ